MGSADRATCFRDAIRAIADHQDRAAFSLLFEYFAPRIKSYLLRFGMAGSAAEDLAQETLLTVWRKAAQFNPAKAEVATWIFTIARNLRIDALRRERFPETDDGVLEALEDESRPADETVEDGEQAKRIRAALDSLPPEQAEVMTLSFFEDIAHNEIARRLGIPLGTVKSRLRLAMNRIRSCLEE